MSLPTGWTTAPIGTVCRLINGRAFKPSDWTPDGLPIVRIQNLNNAAAQFNRYNKPVEEKFLIDSGELLFAWSGTPGTSFGAHIWERGPAVLNQHIFRVGFDPSTLDKRYLRFAINERLDHLIDVAHGGAGLAHVTKPVFESTEILVPPLAEQRRIVAKLDDVLARSRRAKAALDAIPPLLEKLRQSILAAAFRGDLTASFRAQHPDVEPAEKLLARIRVERRKKWEEAELAKMRAKGKVPGDERWKAKYEEPEPVDAEGLPELPEGWCWISAEEATGNDIAYGIVQPGPNVEDGVPLIRAMDLEDGRILEEQLGRTARGIAAEYQRTSLVPGDVLLGIVRAAKVAVVPPSLAGANVVRGIARLQPAGGMLPEALAAWLASPLAQQELLKKHRGIDMPVINIGDVRRLPVPLAPLAEQQQITHIVAGQQEVIRRLTLSSQAMCQRADAVERASLAKAFRGELVPQDPNDEPAEAMLARLRATSAAAASAATSTRRRTKKTPA